MPSNKSWWTAIAVASTLFAISAPAHAQATRTWVSGIGNDADPCSRTAPCKTFAGAIIKTATNGIINCLDPGGYGGVTITRSMTIDCHDILGSILVGDTPGIVINIPTGDPKDPLRTARLRNIDISGVGGGGQGIRSCPQRQSFWKTSRLRESSNRPSAIRAPKAGPCSSSKTQPSPTMRAQPSTRRPRNQTVSSSTMCLQSRIPTALRLQRATASRSIVRSSLGTQPRGPKQIRVPN